MQTRINFTATRSLFFFYTAERHASANRVSSSRLSITSLFKHILACREMRYLYIFYLVEIRKRVLNIILLITVTRPMLWELHSRAELINRSSERGLVKRGMTVIIAFHCISGKWKCPLYVLIPFCWKKIIASKMFRWANYAQTQNVGQRDIWKNVYFVE